MLLFLSRSCSYLIPLSPCLFASPSPLPRFLSLSLSPSVFPLFFICSCPLPLCSHVVYVLAVSWLMPHVSVSPISFSFPHFSPSLMSLFFRCLSSLLHMFMSSPALSQFLLLLLLLSILCFPMRGTCSPSCAAYAWRSRVRYWHSTHDDAFCVIFCAHACAMLTFHAPIRV